MVCGIRGDGGRGGGGAAGAPSLHDGAFDVTVGPLVNLWGFGPAGQPRRVPSQGEIEQLLQTTGYQLLETRAAPPAMRKQHADVQVDLSAIAKGYAVDEVAHLLDRLGAQHYMVEIGGEVRTRGKRSDGNAWRIALESPVAGTREVLRIIPLSDLAMATSGDYRNYFELDGVRYSHTIDPRTGWPVAHELTAASVIAAGLHARRRLGDRDAGAGRRSRAWQRPRPATWR